MKLEVELELDDEVIDEEICKAMLRIMQDMDGNSMSIPYFSNDDKEEAKQKKKLAKAARRIHSYHSVHTKHINKDFSNLYE